MSAIHSFKTSENIANHASFLVKLCLQNVFEFAKSQNLKSFSSADETIQPLSSPGLKNVSLGSGSGDGSSSSLNPTLKFP